jgi:hypothetical protein
VTPEGDRRSLCSQPAPLLLRTRVGWLLFRCRRTRCCAGGRGAFEAAQLIAERRTWCGTSCWDRPREGAPMCWYHRRPESSPSVRSWNEAAPASSRCSKELRWRRPIVSHGGTSVGVDRITARNTQLVLRRGPIFAPAVCRSAPNPVFHCRPMTRSGSRGGSAVPSHGDRGGWGFMAEAVVGPERPDWRDDSTRNHRFLVHQRAPDVCGSRSGLLCGSGAAHPGLCAELAARLACRQFAAETGSPWKLTGRPRALPTRLARVVGRGAALP